MSVDPTWPYPDAKPALVEELQLSWACPTGDCVCHPPTGELETTEHTVVFFDEAGRRLPGARCRIFNGGRLLNTHQSNADSAGALLLEIPTRTTSLEVEWVPANLPQGARYPFRKTYFVDRGDREEQRLERRLHNLGFASERTLRGNILDFQRAYRMKPTGRVRDVAATVKAFHDQGLLPPIPTGVAAEPKARSAGTQVGGVHFLDDPETGKPTPPAPPHPLVANPNKTGSVAAVQTTKIRLVLVRAFALFVEDFDQFDDVPPWPAPPPPEKEKQAKPKKKRHERDHYDAHEWLTRLYPGKSNVFRLGRSRIAGATVDVGEPGFPPLDSGRTNSQGVATFTLPVARPDGQVLAFTVHPPKGQLNSSGLAAGPGMTDGSTTADFLYRPFTVLITLDSQGAPMPDRTVIMPDDRPRFAKLIEHRPSFRGDDVILDWRPDWMRAKKRSPDRVLDTGEDPDLPVAPHTPVNPFDGSVSADKRRLEAPPAIVLHQTGTHNMNAISGHLKISSVVGSHYWVDLDGFVVKMVDELFKSNHAGASTWSQRASVNQFSVGIETLHTDTIPFAPEKGDKVVVVPRRFMKEQYETLIRVCRELFDEYPIAARHVVGHMEVKVADASEKGPNVRSRIIDGTLSRERIGCPGDHFAWERLERAGVALSPLTFPPVLPGGFGPAVQATHAEIVANLTDVALISPTTSGKPTSDPRVLTVKRLLFDIGYSLAKTLTKRSLLTPTFDSFLVEALRVFQTRHFSGRRRRYAIIGTASHEKGTFPPMSTLDRATIEKLKDVWWTVQQP